MNYASYKVCPACREWRPANTITTENPDRVNSPCDTDEENQLRSQNATLRTRLNSATRELDRTSADLYEVGLRNNALNAKNERLTKAVNDLSNTSPDWVADRLRNDLQIAKNSIAELRQTESKLRVALANSENECCELRGQVENYLKAHAGLRESAHEYRVRADRAESRFAWVKRQLEFISAKI